MKLSQLKGVCGAVNQGALIGDLPFPGFDGISLRVRGLGNADYQRVYGELAADLPRDGDGDLAAADRERLVTECLKQAVLIGWEGIDDPFTAELAAEAFADPDLGPIFRNAVLYAAGRVATDAAAAIEADAKN